MENKWNTSNLKYAVYTLADTNFWVHVDVDIVSRFLYNTFEVYPYQFRYVKVHIRVGTSYMQFWCKYM